MGIFTIQKVKSRKIQKYKNTVYNNKAKRMSAARIVQIKEAKLANLN